MAVAQEAAFTVTLKAWFRDWKFVVLIITLISGTVAGLWRLQLERIEVKAQVRTLAHNDSLRVAEYSSLYASVDSLRGEIAALQGTVGMANESLDTLLSRAGFASWLRRRR